MWIWLFAHSLDIIILLGATILMIAAYIFSDDILKLINKLGDKLNK